MNETVEIDLKEIFRALLKKAWLIALCAVVVSAAVLVYTIGFVTPMYQAKVTAYVNNGSAASDGTISSGNYSVALRLVNSYVAILKSDNVLEKVIEQEKLDLSVTEVRGMLTAAPVEDTEMFEFQVTCSDPKLAARIANAIAKVAPEEIPQIMKGSSAAIIDYAKIPTSRHSPNYVQNTLIGALVGILAAIVVIVLQETLNVKIKDEEDLAKVAPIPVLGVIPDLTSDAKQHVYKSYKTYENAE